MHDFCSKSDGANRESLFLIFGSKSFSCEKLKFSEVIWATFKTQIKILFFKQNLPIDEQTQTQN